MTTFTRKDLLNLNVNQLHEIAKLLTPEFKGEFGAPNYRVGEGIYDCTGLTEKDCPVVKVQFRLGPHHDSRPQYLFRIIGEGYVRSIISEDEVEAISKIIHS